MKRKIQIAIDGPASAGKSTVAKLVAKKLGYIYCDTGAMYRAVTYAAMKKDIRLDNDKDLNQLLQKLSIEFVPANPEQKVYVDNVDVTKEIRLPGITNNVSIVAAQSSVRTDLTKRQQQIAQAGGIVMDGRDIGTTVLPNAQVKIFLVASAKKRALRRYKENILKEINTPLDVLEQEIIERDYKDSHRKISPLVQASDAIEIDTTELTIDEVVREIMKIIENRLN
ncbi:(d)CMP kinase [Ligilactobacillus sp. WILCCON 0076]|uniref:Cytidylate kinase n=1 Tax=Ligilactobacillus ubinensis TaxID=2876789 RepID=A0A9X2FLY3_9LACO|nr:(d)CMP kinase [Ligilactobacillus ubinensis]MCP0887695.1 (d)CMP kinase [Ligilactobacillus ubinensis]